VIEPIFETSMDESELASALEQGLTESRRTPGHPMTFCPLRH
jgi:hypothetical protein